jgi:thiosulfate dehydrogenase
MRSGDDQLLKTLRMAMVSIALLLALMIGLISLLVVPRDFVEREEEPLAVLQPKEWEAPDSTLIPESAQGDLIRYGRELIAHTSIYLGPSGTVSAISNGMNCQNCHLKAGKKVWGNNYSAVASTYPKFRGRSGTLEGVEKRVNDCLQRSLNGKPLEEQSPEMKAMVAYILWVGSEVPVGAVPEGAWIDDLPVMDRAADPIRGKSLYVAQCVRCHGPNGEGLRQESGNEWKYPPLWGANSFNTGAGLFRLSRMAGFIQRNMPNDVQDSGSKLSNEDAWDVAAFICSQPRPIMDLSGDWPDISWKPFDHPFGPYADPYSEQQHKFGPYNPILAGAKKK